MRHIDSRWRPNIRVLLYASIHTVRDSLERMYIGILGCAFVTCASFQSCLSISADVSFHSG